MAFVTVVEFIKKDPKIMLELQTDPYINVAQWVIMIAYLLYYSTQGFDLNNVQYLINLNIRKY